MRIMITGAAGFLGAAIIDQLLDSGAQVRAIGRTNKLNLLENRLGRKSDGIEWYSIDVAITKEIVDAAKGCDAIIHLAGVLTPDCSNNPISGAQTNIIGTLNMFEAAKRHGIDKVIYCSSGGVFGPDDNRVPFPLTHYGAFKLANEGNARAYWLDAGISSIGLRPFVVYGPGREIGLSAGPTLACKAAALGEPYTIPMSGKIGLVYIDDVAATFCKAVQRSVRGAHVLNLPGEPIDISRIVEYILDIVPGAQIDFSGPPLPMVSSTRNDYQNNLFDMPSPVSYKIGLKKTIRFYQKTFTG